MSDEGGRDMQVEKRRELTAFLFLTFVLAPLLAVIIVAGYGFLVWMYQMIAGPPSV
ncbi:periplasmic nitrate reductase, NapE protein [Steroidobacter sp.]|uniref:periplasmic nitrate reductase, NapE protein n=1 Tax=Steroidobacter sp. TaxID=1978227 RepID=UPI0032C21D1C